VAIAGFAEIRLLAEAQCRAAIYVADRIIHLSESYEATINKALASRGLLLRR